MAEKKTRIVPQLPSRPYRDYKDLDGKEYDLVTHEEAMEEILEGIRDLKKEMLNKW